MFNSGSNWYKQRFYYFCGHILTSTSLTQSVTMTTRKAIQCVRKQLN